ncbi:MAG TPA: LamG domain-containing protein, partial [Sedimentisphaerales bacterium]|nr:LamG domain-containing protein [Sedimentisphaerales bacterium]
GIVVTSHNADLICSADFDELGFKPPESSGEFLPWGFIGNIGLNAAEQLYVALEDGTGTVSVVTNPDPNAVTATDWQEWNIELTEFANLDFNDVRKVYIGLGDRGTPTEGGSGIVYIDDLRACPPRCVPSLAKPYADIAGPDGVGDGYYDCVVGEEDMAVLIGDWLLRDELITTQAPSDTNLIARYTFDTDYTDSVGGFNLDPNGTVQIVSDAVRGNVLDLSGAGYLQSDHNAVDLGIDGNTPRTFSCWAYTRQFTETGLYEVGQHVDGQDWSLRTTGNTNEWRAQHWGYPTYDFDFSYPSENVWVHFTHVYDGNEVKVYANGVLVGSADVNLNTAGSPKNLSVGKWSDYAPLNGMIDDLRIYDYGLSQAEAAHLATDGAPSLHIPIDSPAELYQSEAPGSQWINFRDYSIIAGSWLEKVLWP